MKTIRLFSENGFLLQSLKEAVDAIPAALFVKDTASRILLMNRACEEQWGIPFAEIRGTDGGAFFPPDQMDWFRAKDREVFAGGSQVDFEETFWNAKLRQNRTGHTFKKPLFSSDGSPICLVCTTFDITQRQQLENSLSEREARYRGVIETAADGFWCVDTEARLLEVNDAYVRKSGYSREELLGMKVPDLEARETPAQTAAHIRTVLEQGYDRFESVHRRKDGSLWPVEVVVSYWPLEEGRFFVFCKDLSEARKANELMRIATLIYQTSAEAVMVTDTDNNIIDVNPAFTHQTGYTLDEVYGRNPRMLQSGKHTKPFYEELWQALLQQGNWQGELWDRRKDGSLHVKLANISLIRNEDGSIYRHVAQFFDITDRKQKEELIWTQANYDTLTGLPNRRLFHDRLEQETKKANRSGQPLALLFIDLDRFKEVNDTLGHAKGDVLLVEAARRITACVRDTDTVARLGGDEFTVILNEFGDLASLERIAQTIINRLAEAFELGGDELCYVSASIGITLYPNDASNLDELMRHADQAMYVAKAEGRNRFNYFVPFMQHEAQEKLSLTNQLRQALSRGELEVHYQPIVEAATGRLDKAEALLRWNHPQRGQIPPDRFIPLAEESGLIREIGEWVFQQAIANIERWRDRYNRIIQVSVNKSPIQFDHPHSNDWIGQLERTGLPGNCITVEITERLLLKDSPGLRQRLLSFRNAGIEVSIDDFGTGFSALSYLKQFDIDYLKIDRSFVSNLTQQESAQALTEAIIVMAHKLGIKTVAEGVETLMQRELLTAFGCDYLQGFLFSRPLPLHDFEKRLQQETAS
ncbi:MAG: EAL domain-containing protein [Betaproteobacteria bacterium]|nr:EAL domain-containing protein [Betaproteobacteria bacterium]